MADLRVAKLFKNGSSQAVRLPAEFRFEGEEVYVRRDERTGDVILTTSPAASTWARFFGLVQASNLPTEYMATRPLNQAGRTDE